MLSELFTALRGHRVIERGVAVASFLAAVCLAFFSLLISERHNIIGEASMLVAQFLLLTASIFGIDYKFSTPYGSTGNSSARVQEQQPVEH